jgi:hypothetical protein
MLESMTGVDDKCGLARIIIDPK